MKIYTSGNDLRLLLDPEEAGMLDHLVGQLLQLMQSHSSTTLDPDPLFASLEIGGSEHTPDDPALAKLFPDAFLDPDEAADFRRVTEQGLINRKLQDAMQVTSDLGLGSWDESTPVDVVLTTTSLPSWMRTITSLRLAIAARIGIETSADHERLVDHEDTRGTVLVFDWLAGLLDAVLMLTDIIDTDTTDTESASDDDSADPAAADE